MEKKSRREYVLIGAMCDTGSWVFFLFFFLYAFNPLGEIEFKIISLEHEGRGTRDSRIKKKF